MDKTLFEKIVKSARKRAGKGQEEMAKTIGITRQAYSRREKGSLTLLEADEICRHLNLKLLIITEEQI